MKLSCYFLFFDTGVLTDGITQVEQTGTANLTTFNYFNFADKWRFNGEDTFHTHTVRNFTYSECFGSTLATTLNNNTLEVLDTLFVTFSDLI